jgi:hypothetical protein
LGNIVVVVVGVVVGGHIFGMGGQKLKVEIEQE